MVEFNVIIPLSTEFVIYCLALNTKKISISNYADLTRFGKFPLCMCVYAVLLAKANL